MANNIVVQYMMGMNTVLNGVVALRTKDEKGKYVYWFPEEDGYDDEAHGNMIGYLERTGSEPLNNEKRFVRNTNDRSRLYNIDKIARIRTDHRDGGFKYWVRYNPEGQ